MPEVPMTPPDQGRGLALAGFLCGLGAIIASALAGIFTSGAVLALSRVLPSPFSISHEWFMAA